ncbi:MAG: discoidin domain-containing protein [Armatimonadetes bacterium]|nr:discoidin domain-containing protein [Armatimonadota bacterium]
MQIALLSLLLSGAAWQPAPESMVVADTYIDRKSPGVNFGRSPLLFGGAGRAILLRFPELGLTDGAGRRVHSASLVLTMATPLTASLESIGRTLRPWGEGGWTADDFQGEAPPVPVGAATWNRARAGKDGLRWDRSGAAGRNDAEPIGSAFLSPGEEELVIGGLGSAVQQMIDDPGSNFGFRLEFESSVAFFSADSLARPPTLLVTYADAQMQASPDLQIVACEPIGLDLASPPKDGDPVKWTVTVRNVGDVSSKAQTISWTDAANKQQMTSLTLQIGAGETAATTVTVPWAARAEGRPAQPFTLRVVAAEGELNPSDNGATVYMDALTIALPGVEPGDALAVVTNLNEIVFPFSKFGAWPEGCLERLRIVQAQADANIVVQTGGDDLRRDVLMAVTGLPARLLGPFEGPPPRVSGITAPGFLSDPGQLGLLPDSRDDLIVSQVFPIPDRTSTARVLGEVPLREHGLLSRSETTVLNLMLGKTGADRTLPWNLTPSMVIFTVRTPDGVAPKGARLDVYQLIGGAFGARPVFSGQIGTDGRVLMPSQPGGSLGKSNPYGDLRPDGSNAWLLAVVRSSGVAHSTWLPVWQLWDEYARGNTAAAFIELRVQLSSGPLDRSQNLATGKVATDAKGRFPAELNAAIDGSTETALPLDREGDGYWLEIDLGRDRQIGEIALVFDGPVWKRFRILTYKTAQSPEAALVWAEEANGPAHPQTETTPDGKTVLIYRSQTVRSRFIRIVPLSQEAVHLAEIQVVPIRSAAKAPFLLPR